MFQKKTPEKRRRWVRIQFQEKIMFHSPKSS
jgi:hypothetical protein